MFFVTTIVHVWEQFHFVDFPDCYDRQKRSFQQSFSTSFLSLAISKHKYDK